MWVYVWASGLTLLNLVWLGATVIGLPGNWLMIASAAGVAWWLDVPFVGKWVFVAALVLAGIGEGIELLAGAVGSKIGGGGKWAPLGALGGGIAGAILGTVLIPIPVLGTILGAALGAFGGSAAAERLSGKSTRASLRTGGGAALGHVTGNVTKSAIGAAIWLLLAVAAFF